MRGNLMKDSDFNQSQSDLEAQRHEWERRQRRIDKITQKVDLKMKADSGESSRELQAESRKAIERALKDVGRGEEYDARPDPS